MSGKSPLAARTGAWAPAAAGRRQSAPGPRGHRLLGCLLEVRRDPLSFVLRSAREYGDLAEFRMGPRRLFLLNHPAHFRYVLTENPENYSKGVGLHEARPFLGDGLLTAGSGPAAIHRRVLQSAFHRDRLHGFGSVMTGAAEAMLGRWRSGEPLDAAREMTALTLGVLGATLIPFDFAPRADAVGEDLAVLSRWAMGRMTALAPWPLALPTPGNLRVRRSLRRLQGLAGEVVEARRRSPSPDAADLVALMLAPGSGFAERQIREEIQTFLLAGHETTAATLAWTWHLLSRHPQVEERLHEELDRVLAGRVPTLEDLPRLTFTRAMIEEVLRLYPPVWMIPRRAIGEDEIDGCRIPAGSDLLLSVYSLHRHPGHWPEPERFDPDRFVRAEGRTAPAAYFPFGAGARSCLGSHFGMMEATLVVATVARRFRLAALAEGPVEAEASLTLRPRHGLPMVAVERAR